MVQVRQENNQRLKEIRGRLKHKLPHSSHETRVNIIWYDEITCYRFQGRSGFLTRQDWP